MKNTRIREVTERATISVSRSEIIKAFKESGILRDTDNVDIYVEIPRGGDYSGMNLSVGGEHLLIIQTKTTYTE